MCREETESSLTELDVHIAELFSTVVSSDTVFVTLFPTAAETERDASVLAILIFCRFSALVLTFHRVIGRT